MVPGHGPGYVRPQIWKAHLNLMEAFFKVNNIRDEEKKISYLTLSLNHRLISIKLAMLDLPTVFDVHKTDYNVYVQPLTAELS